LQEKLTVFLRAKYRVIKAQKKSGQMEGRKTFEKQITLVSFLKVIFFKTILQTSFQINFKSL